jgi:hypothetical protein
MFSSFLNIPMGQYRALMKHLLPVRAKTEEAAFVFCRIRREDAETEFEFLDMHPAARSEFNYRSLYGIELNDNCRASVISRAHDLDASLLEFHSHPQASEVEFSPSDRKGFAEFIPHVWWRLKKKPYAAVVVGPGGFDSLSWVSSAERPDGVLEIRAGQKLLRPTGLSFGRWGRAYDFEA